MIGIRRFVGRLKALVVLACALCSTMALGGDIYRCQVNGVTTFVDSPRRCSEGQPQRMGGAESKQELLPRRATVEGIDSRPAPGVETRSRAPLVTPPSASNCQKFEQTPARARECLREERRLEVRRIGSARLQTITLAAAQYLNAGLRSGNVIAMPTKGSPPSACESVISDLLSRKNVDIVDDELSPPGRSTAPILDPDYKEWRIADERIPNGYVTARWRSSEMVVMRIAAACVEADDGTARCVKERYTSVHIYSPAIPLDCNVSVIGRAYWPNWKNSKTPIFTKATGPLGSDR
jgi:hypothetical protein